MILKNKEFKNINNHVLKLHKLCTFRYDAMSRIYYRGAKAAIICYDIIKSNTFQRAKFWIRELRTVEEGCKIYICATKNDILKHGAVPSPDINVVETYAAGIQAKFFITSSKTGENVGKDQHYTFSLIS